MGRRTTNIKYRDIIGTDEIYHIYNKSIAGFKIFNNDVEFARMKLMLDYYQTEKPLVKFSHFFKNYLKQQRTTNKDNKHVSIIAYCLMPTHIHLILRQLKEKGISSFMSNICNSYTRYFNLKHKRKGPLWEGRFKRVIVKTDGQLLHLTRYIHLNPVTLHLVDKPEKWSFSSYREYLSEVDDNCKVCFYSDVLDITPKTYRNFVEERIDYQRELAKIKDIIFETNSPYSTS